MSTNFKDWSLALAALEPLKTVAILTHVRPDGDAYGSLLALGLALEARGKKVSFYNEDGLLERYRFLPGSEKILKTPEQKPEVDAIIAVDNATYKRLGPSFVKWNADILINIDHHISNESYGKFNFIDGETPATGQVLFELFSKANWEITPKIADNLFVAISTDTGSFKYRNTTTRTFEVAAALSKAGANIADMSYYCYGCYPLRRTRLLKEVLQKLQFRCNDRLAYYPLTQKMYQTSGAEPEDTEGMIETIISNEGVDLAILFEEKSEGVIKLSFRSKGKVNVSELAAKFSGGGHREAAGAQLRASLAEAQEKVLLEAEKALSKI